MPEPAFPTDARRVLEIVPVGDVAPALLRWLAAELGPRFGARCVLGRRFAPRAEWRRSGQAQYPADALLDALLDWHAARSLDRHRHWLLGVTFLDLAAPDRPFVFGEATVGGCCGVIAAARLREDGAAADDAALLRSRLLKEAVHELGHVAGLPHCENSGCVMYPSPDRAATDRKPSDFCPRCQARLEEALGGRA
jgi:predicted Zn-dependent protease